MLRTYRRKILYTAIQFTHNGKSIGVVLLACTVLSLIVSNSSIGENYVAIWHLALTSSGNLHLPATPLEIINDVLMAVFFFLAGLEIKREIISGELKTVKKALLPVLAALGGVVMPAVIFYLCNRHTAYAHGWGIPTATDIAFSLGIAALLGRQYFPDSLRIFLTALAIIDDLIAIVIVAVFYGESISAGWLLAAMAIVALLVFIFKKKVHPQWFHYLLGMLLWYCVYRSGIHATVAGVLFAFCIPIDAIAALERKLHTPVNFGVVPLFAIANTCIVFPAETAAVFSRSLCWGILLGLVIGKPVGILLTSWLLVKFNLAKMPVHVNWYEMTGAGMLAGIGFTMSIFIATLAYDNPEWQDIAKIAVLLGSLVSMVVGFIWLKLQRGKQKMLFKVR